jgi:hypothetical protein
MSKRPLGTPPGKGNIVRGCGLDDANVLLAL